MMKNLYRPQRQHLKSRLYLGYKVYSPKNSDCPLTRAKKERLSALGIDHQGHNWYAGGLVHQTMIDSGYFTNIDIVEFDNQLLSTVAELELKADLSGLKQEPGFWLAQLGTRCISGLKPGDLGNPLFFVNEIAPHLGRYVIANLESPPCYS